VPTFAAHAVLFGFLLQLLIGGVPGLGYLAGTKLFGWPDLASRIERVEDAIELETGRQPLVVGMDKYNIASQLAFYRTRLNLDPQDPERNEGVQSTTGRQWFGKESLMFGYWPVAGGREGRTLILVGDERQDLDALRVTSSFARLTPVTPIVTQDHGRPGREFFYRVGYGFQP
jgi:dolichol-phosphate mannosyltransferase